MFILDRSGMGGIAKSDAIRALVRDATREVAAAARAGTDLPVRVSDGTTDRAVGSVTLADPAGAATQAKHGVLTKAAMAVGLDVKA